MKLTASCFGSCAISRSKRRRAFESRLFAQDETDAAQRIASDVPTAQTGAEAADELAFIMEAVSRLPERTRRVFFMHRVEGLTLIEVGTRLGLSKSLVHELVVSTLEDCRKDAVYDADMSSVHAGKDAVERYKGINTADVFKGMVNVYRGNARNGGAIDPSIRGIQGPGRVPVVIDGTEQALTVWRGYNGASNRSYIAPSLISGVQVLKGPVSARW